MVSSNESTTRALCWFLACLVASVAGCRDTSKESTSNAAAGSGDQPASCLARADEAAAAGDDTRAYTLLRAGCDQGNADCCSQAAFALYLGKGVERDKGAAAAALGPLCDGGHARSCVRAGKADFDGSIGWYKKGCALDDAVACTWLVAALTVEGRIAEALKYLEKACEKPGCGSESGDPCWTGLIGISPENLGPEVQSLDAQHLEGIGHILNSACRAGLVSEVFSDPCERRIYVGDVPQWSRTPPPELDAARIAALRLAKSADGLALLYPEGRTALEAATDEFSRREVAGRLLGQLRAKQRDELSRAAQGHYLLRIPAVLGEYKFNAVHAGIGSFPLQIGQIPSALDDGFTWYRRSGKSPSVEGARPERIALRDAKWFENKWLNKWIIAEDAAKQARGLGARWDIEVVVKPLVEGLAEPSSDLVGYVVDAGAGAWKQPFTPVAFRYCARQAVDRGGAGEPDGRCRGWYSWGRITWKREPPSFKSP